MKKREDKITYERRNHGACNLKCEHLTNPLGIEETEPRLSWQIDDERQGARQTACWIAAASSVSRLKSGPDLWDTGQVNSDQCLDILYEGKQVTSRQAVWWRVCVWDHEGKPFGWCEPACFEMGLLEPSDWKAQWIGSPLGSREGSQPCPFLRKTFAVNDSVARARIYVTARGLFELHLNGGRVGNDYFTPGWTDYNKRIQYLAYDVTDLLHKGKNALGAVLGDGWYAGYLVWPKNRFLYGDQLSLLLQLEVEYADGTREEIITDSSWKTSFGPILKSDIYHGEIYDARCEQNGWSTPGWENNTWQQAAVFPNPSALIVAKRNMPVRKQGEMPTAVQTEPSFGVHIFDLGQNMVGWARIKVRAPAGTDVKIRYGETLDADGTLYTANLRSAECTDHYICKGAGEEVYEPRFTFHGFRYVELTGLCKKPVLTDVTGIVLHTEIPSTGLFECSDALINRLQQNIIWGQKGNFLEVPTDCPQRDERLGWTGDAQVFIRTAAFNRDVAAFFTKWCIDLSDSQFPDGGFPSVAPDVIRNECRGVPAWADAGVICPWTIYLCYGDRRILERQYDSMKSWIEWQRKNSVDLINSPEANFGDWLALDINEGKFTRSLTPRELIGTAYFAYSTSLFACIAKILNRNEDARKYAGLFTGIKAAFNREFVTPRGRVMSETQTAYLLALGFDLLPKSKQAYAVSRLINAIKKRDWHLSTGFVGTPLLAPVLTRFGHVDVAYKLLFKQTCPSWLYPILQGATTMWERWNGYTKELGFNDVSMNSFNHYAYGAIGEWMYNTITGIELDPEVPGYKHIIIRPQLPSLDDGENAKITWARGELMTRYGRVVSYWKIDGGKLLVSVIIPPNTTATIILPGQKPEEVGAGSWEFNAVYERYNKK